MIVKAKVTQGSASDPDGLGRVLLQAAGLWQESLLTPVVGGVPLNVGDIVFVDLRAGDDSPLVLGRCRDGMWATNGSEVGDSFSVLWESVSADGGTWSVAYVEGETFTFENSSGFVFRSIGDCISLHDGSNGGLVNVSAVRSLAEAVMGDLSALGSVANISQWFGRDYPRLEDTKVLH